MEITQEGYWKAKAVPVEVEGSDVWMQLGVTRNGKEFARVVLEFIEGPYVGERQEWDGWLSNLESENRTIQALRIMGWTGQDILAAQYVPLPNVVTAVVKKDKPKEGRENDAPRFRIAFVNDPKGGGQFRAKPVESAALKGLAQRVNKTAAKVPVIVEKPREPGSDDDEDDVRF